MTDFAELRRMMVDGQLRTFDIQDSSVLDAMGLVPRECFVDVADREIAYADRAAHLREGNRGLLSPMVLARMLQAARISGGERVLDVCGGTGYSAAVMRTMGCTVVAWDPEAVFQAGATRAIAQAGFSDVGVLQGETIHAIASSGPFDVILVNGCCEEEPTELFSLLNNGGRLVAIMQNGAAQSVRVFKRSGNEMGRVFVGNGNGPMIDLFSRKAAFVF